MAVTSVKILHNGWTASDTAGSGITFNVIYQVEVNDKNDGPLIVLNGEGVPRVGEYYEIGNDIDPFAFVKSVSPTPKGERIWNVAVTFGPIEPSDEGASNGRTTAGLTPEGEPTDDPLMVRASMTVSTVLAQRAATRGAYFGRVEENVVGEWNLIPEGFIPEKPPVVEHPKMVCENQGHCEIADKTPITNSVFTPYDPPPEIDYSRTRLTIKFNLKANPDAPWGLLAYVNMINKEDVFFKDALGDTVCFAKKFCARIMGVSYEERFMKDTFYWSTQIDVLIDNIFGWRLDILDRGYCEQTYKGFGEESIKENVTDQNGVPLAEPVLLDGMGGQLNTDELSAVYLQYGVFNEFDFNLDNLNRPQAFQNAWNGDNGW